MISTRKLQLEIEEKNDIISILREELESTKEQNDKFRKENIQLLKDSNKVKFLQDELDCLQDKVAKGEQLELEIERLKEKIAREQDFLKIRIDELEDDKRKAREESKQFEDKLLKAEAALSRVVELEDELNKWKSFSHELESERNIIQSKLLESIEQETKLEATNKQVEYEVKRLKALIKSYEEQRDEEQASNSLIMSVADLKQMDQAFSQQQQLDGQQPTADCRNPQDAEKLNRLQELDEELASNKRLIADLRQDLACEKSLTLRLTKQLTSFTKQIKNLDKQYFPYSKSNDEAVAAVEKEKEEEVKEDQAREKIEARAKAVESSPQKSVTSFKYQQPTDFNQISPSNPEALKASSRSESHVGSQEQLAKAGLQEERCAALAHPNRSTPISEEKTDTRLQSPGAADATAATITTATAPTTSDADCRSTTPTQLGDKVPSASKEVNPISAQPFDGSQQISTSASACAKAAVFTMPATTANLLQQTTSTIIAQPDQQVKQSKSSDRDLLTDGLNTDGIGGAEIDSNSSASIQKQHDPANQSSRSRSTSSNFVRNSLPSRSVNFGHSKSSAFLERIRASVKATTTTNTTSSFNEQTQNVLLSQPSQPVPNCSLDHQHSERCFIAKNMVRVHNSREVSGDNFCHQNAPHMQPSRQLNALIDPVSQEQLMMSMMHQVHKPLQHHQHQQHLNKLHPEGNLYAPDGTKLTGQQIAHLASLHQQHYYHHLQHMHQLHEMHHKHYLHHQYHRLHHKYQQQQTAGDLSPPTVPSQQEDINCNQALQRTLCEPIYSGGSQFQAPLSKLDQVYANMAANNNINLMNEQQQKLRTRLVNNNNNNNNRQEQANSTSQRKSPVRQTTHRTSPQRSNNEQLNSHYTLPQIDEVNGLPTVDLKGCFQHSSARKQQRNAQVVMTSEAVSTATKQHSSSTNGSPSSSSSSPTSSTSSHLSASSASSSSSLSSLSTSNAHPKRSTPSRHTTTDQSRRQFSVERELVGALPMTATLSRVGSCRANRSADEASLLCNLQIHDATQMRTPVKSKQPSMRTSKILNISQQSAATTPPPPLPQHQACPQQQLQEQNLQLQQTIANSQLCNRRLSAERDVNSVKLASNLANIRLNDSLAFTSLRAPKSSASGSGIKRMLTENNNIIGQNTTPIVKLPTTSNPADKRRQIGNTANDNGGGNKSSVWFEYGCV